MYSQEERLRIVKFLKDQYVKKGVDISLEQYNELMSKFDIDQYDAHDLLEECSMLVDKNWNLRIRPITDPCGSNA